MKTNKYEVSSVIKSLKNKGNGLYDIGVLTIKKNLQVFSKHISMLYNHSIDTLTYPGLVENARVVLGYKSGSKENIDNYRPISNLPVFSKILKN